MQFKNIIYAKDEEKGIARITINRPEARNALNQPTRIELREVVEKLKKDESIRVVIITGAGDKAFVAGADLSTFKDASPITAEELASTLGQQLYSDIENLPVPVIAMINGFCLGGGLELAMCCDIRIASTSAKFGQPEINVGLFPGGGGTQRLPRIVGWGIAKELIYTGKLIDAEEAAKLGLINRAVPPEELVPETMELAKAIASKSPLIIRLIKKTINRGIYTDLDAGLSYEKSSWALLFASEDKKEGINAFLEKRAPEFKGR